MGAPVEQVQSVQAAPPKPFQLGLALAGAISAGAYTAGALDFLFQALSEWEAQRDQPGVPQHRVVLKVMAGASAGAITGALGAVGLARGLQPRLFDSGHDAICYPDHYPVRQKIECVIPSLRQTWVELPAMVSADGIGGLLGTDDIKTATAGDTPILRSLLNASLLDEVKRIAIEPRQEPGAVMPPVPFVAKDLHVYITVSNLRGIPFKVAFGRNSYGMQTIGDRIHYVVRDLGSSDLSEADSWVERDSRLTISVTTLPARRGGNLGDWDLYGTSALASGAYPVGLASRKLGFAWEQYQERCYPIPGGLDVYIQPDFPPGIGTLSSAFIFESVDGGLVNNDPFDYAQYALFGKPPGMPESGNSVERAIVMVAPFPEPPKFLSEGSPSPSVTSILRSLFPSLVNQSRFRASELAPAVSERDFSRFLIAPLRRIPRTDPTTGPASAPPPERFAIACGLLGGFGGFLDEKFRAHDFQLGRRNCQQFLRNSFLLPPDNAIVGRPGTTELQPVIPLVGSAADPIPLPKWPQMTQAAFEQLCDRIEQRIDAIAPHFVNAHTQSVKLRTALKLGWKTFFRDHAVWYVKQTILADLVRREQIEGRDSRLRFDEPVPAQGDVAAIVAELINPAFDFRTPEGIAKSTLLQTAVVNRILQALSQPEVPEAIRAWTANGQYTLYTRRPGYFATNRLTGWISRWWDAPTID